MFQKFKNLLFFLPLILLAVSAFSQEQRFPKPEFENGHTQPPVQTPEPRLEALEYLDVFVLFAALSIVTWLVLKQRSRMGVLLMSVFSIAYFGFFREGCICSVGSLQNIVLALFNSSYAIPITTLLIFLLPLLFTLLFGRTFCAGVCPLGAIQDLVAIKPMEMRPWLQKTLGILPFIYLGLSVLYAATASDFIICRYDPFVGIYRFNGTFFMFALGAVLLLVGVFIARPYCRFLCPYGVILNWVSRFSKTHLTITPASCIQCNLCEHSCPFGAIEKPSDPKLKIDKSEIMRRWLTFSVIVPLLAVFGAWVGYQVHEPLACVNPKVHLAELVLSASEQPDKPEVLDVLSFKQTGKPAQLLYKEAAEIVDKFKLGAILLGAFIGIVIGVTLSGLSRFTFRSDYEPNRATCLSCARCVDFCPVQVEE